MHGSGEAGDLHRGRMAEFFRGPITRDDHDTRTRERFARIDKNSDGVLDAAEIEAAMAQRRGRFGGMMERMGERMRGRMDADRDGKVSKAEHVDRIKTAFAEMDLDNDGKITDADLPPPMRGKGVLSGEGGGRGIMGRGSLGGGGIGMMGAGPFGQLLRGADTNKDGAVTLDEVLAVAEKRFAERDRNKDGVLDKADGDLARKEMTDYRVKRFIHHFGADKDGKVTREQFKAKADARFAMMDANNDGQITRDEMPWRGRGGRGHHGMMGGEHGAGGPGSEGPRRGGPRGSGEGERRL
jgi:Ca2+-binding EF-hand superfamily protein